MKNLWVIGLVLIIGASFLNGLLIHFEIGGILRELMRVVILVGLGVFVFGLIKRNT